jgi:hypothetical protein
MTDYNKRIVLEALKTHDNLYAVIKKIISIELCFPKYVLLMYLDEVSKMKEVREFIKEYSPELLVEKLFLTSEEGDIDDLYLLVVLTTFLGVVYDFDKSLYNSFKSITDKFYQGEKIPVEDYNEEIDTPNINNETDIAEEYYTKKTPTPKLHIDIDTSKYPYSDIVDEATKNYIRAQFLKPKIIPQVEWIQHYLKTHNIPYALGTATLYVHKQDDKILGSKYIFYVHIKTAGLDLFDGKNWTTYIQYVNSMVNFSDDMTAEFLEMFGNSCDLQIIDGKEFPVPKVENGYMFMYDEPFFVNGGTLDK